MNLELDTIFLRRNCLLTSASRIYLANVSQDTTIEFLCKQHFNPQRKANSNYVLTLTLKLDISKNAKVKKSLSVFMSFYQQFRTSGKSINLKRSRVCSSPECGDSPSPMGTCLCLFICVRCLSLKRTQLSPKRNEKRTQLKTDGPL